MNPPATTAPKAMTNTTIPLTSEPIIPPDSFFGGGFCFFGGFGHVRSSAAHVPQEELSKFYASRPS